MPGETYEHIAAKGSYSDAALAPKLTLPAAEKIIEQQASEITKLKAKLHQAELNVAWEIAQRFKDLV
jgi:hypothetical protein